MGWSLAKDLAVLWQLGLPMLLGGQLAILFVVIWQLETVFHSNRATFVALHAVDEHLRQVRLHPAHRQPGDTCTGPAASTGQGSGDANSHVLLDHLRAQLETLADRLDRPRDAA